jgi:hypothetical protein
MDEFIARENIKHFHELLPGEQDETKRKALLQLLAQEELKLAEALRHKKAEKDEKRR